MSGHTHIHTYIHTHIHTHRTTTVTLAAHAVNYANAVNYTPLIICHNSLCIIFICFYIINYTPISRAFICMS